MPFFPNYSGMKVEINYEKKAEKLTEENLEEKFRELMFNNSNWLKDRFKKKKEG